MKKNIFSILALTLLLIFSCNNDSDDSVEVNEDSLSIEEAKVWFEANHDPIMVLDTKKLELHSKSQKRKPIVFQNKWEHSFKSKKGNLHVVEVAMRSQGRFGMATREAMDKYKETGNRGYVTSLSRLVVVKDKKEKTTRSVIMTMFGDVDYLERKNFQLWSNTYLHKDNDFNGLVYFHSLDGKFMNAWRLKNGKVIGKVTEKIKGQGLSASQNCTYEPVYIVYEQCTDWYNMGELDNPNGTTCDYWMEYSHDYIDCETTDTDIPPYIDPFDIPLTGGGGSFEEIINNLTGKPECVYNKLVETSTGFKAAIKKFDGEFPVSHLKLEGSTTLPSNINAKTLPPSNYLITIQVNENNLSRPNLSIARTIIHETIHAEMFRKILSIIDNGGDLDGLTASEWTQKLSNGNYEGILDYYTRFGVNGMQHQQMAAHYRTTISDLLKEFQPGLSQNVYDSLAWVGLKNTVSWNSLTTAEKNAINNTIDTFNSSGAENCN